MIRGTTPTYTFKLSIDPEAIRSIWITFKQELTLEDDRVLTKTMDDGVTYDGATVSLTLTQEETLGFKENIPIEIQGKVYTTDEKVMATSIKKDDCNRILCEEVMA